jgi:hypothetical protein
MSNYTKTTNFLAKDSLPENDSGKIIKGSEFDTEFNALQTAVNTKADLASPALTGVPTAPTASVGTNTTQISTTAFVQAALALLYPIGAIYSSTSSTNPGTIFGFGTWVAYGAGRVLIGHSGTGLYIAGNTGGSADAITVAHTHTGTTDSTSLTGSATYISETWNSSGTATGIFSKVTGFEGSSTPTNVDNSNSGQLNINATHTHAFTTGSTGSSGTNANLQPYVVVYMWNRTA